MDDLRYPIGRFNGQPAATPAARDSAIATIRDLPALLREAVDGLSAAQLNTPYREGGWTVRQVVHHVADSHMNALLRWKLALTEDWPAIKAYDEAAWARLADTALPVELSLTLVESLHSRWVAILESLSDADFERGYVHSQSGRQPLSLVLPLYAWHSLHHTAHITSLRTRKEW